MSDLHVNSRSGRVHVCVCTRVCLCVREGEKWGLGWTDKSSLNWMISWWSNMMSSLQCTVVFVPPGGAVQLYGQRQRTIPQCGVPLLPAGNWGQLHTGQPPCCHRWYWTLPWVGFLRFKTYTPFYAIFIDAMMSLFHRISKLWGHKVLKEPWYRCVWRYGQGHGHPKWCVALLPPLRASRRAGFSFLLGWHGNKE